MKLPKINKKAALIATAIGTLVVSNVASYRNAYSSGYKTSVTESRVGYILAPETSGELIVAEVNGKPHYSFEPYSGHPRFDKKRAWNSKENRDYLEWSIKNEAVLTNDQDQRLSIASASCVAQTTPNFWSCTWRKLGESYNNQWRVEVNPENGLWQSN
jgi:hypothetical protein